MKPRTWRQLQRAADDLDLRLHLAEGVVTLFSRAPGEPQLITITAGWQSTRDADRLMRAAIDAALADLSKQRGMT